MAIIDMQTMRYINLLDRKSKVKTSKCFVYNNVIIFAVEKSMVHKAIGYDAKNIRAISDEIGKKIRVIEEAKSLNDANRFIEDVVSPVNFKSIEIKDKELILNAGSQSKAALIGRNRRRFEELKKIVKDTFDLDFKII